MDCRNYVHVVDMLYGLRSMSHMISFTGYMPTLDVIGGGFPGRESLPSGIDITRL